MTARRKLLHALAAIAGRRGHPVPHVDARFTVNAFAAGPATFDARFEVAVLARVAAA